MWDNNHPAVRVPVDELLAMVKSMYRISGHTFLLVSQLYIIRSLSETGLLNTLLWYAPRLVSTDEAVRMAAEQEMFAAVKPVVEPLQAFNSKFLPGNPSV